MSSEKIKLNNLWKGDFIMSEEKKFTDPIPTTTPKKSKTKNWVLSAIGLVLIVLGSLSVFQTETMNNLAIEIGSKTVASEMMEAYPEHTEIWVKGAEIIESAIIARTTSPDALGTIINDEITKLTGSETPEVKEIIKCFVDHINSIWKSSETEEIYIEKLKSLVSGIKKAV